MSVITAIARHKGRTLRAAAVLLILDALFALAAFFLFTTGGHAETPEERGLAIAMAADAADNGWGDQISSLTMTLTNRHGQTSIRQTHSRTLEVRGDGDKTLIVFDSPKDVQGTALLSFTHKDKTDDQWLFLPALKRTKRISSSNKSGAFMGSEFAYEDISSQEPEKYNHRYLRDEVLDGMECFVVERDPLDPNSGYSRQEIWWDKEHYRPLKIEYYDRKGDHLKTMTQSDFKQYGRFWRADTFFMENHQTGKTTHLAWTGYKFGNGFTDAEFTQAALKRAH
ncbi:MAG: outer membrane lipoprotein-sorting protein [Leptospirillia bacterium]